MPIRTCALCLTPSVEIRDSHLLAAAFYRRVRGASGHPVLVTRRAIVETSEQIKAHLLCDACEGRLKSREDWVINVCWQSPDAFPLLELLADGPTLSSAGESDRGYSARDVPAAKIDEVVYFGASVFWRAGARRWPQLEKAAQISLGPYLEPLRLFLMGAQPFPKRVALYVLLTGNRADASNLAFALPYQSGRNGYRLYRFEVPGITFVLLVGGEIPADLLNFCAARTGMVIAGESVDDIRLRAVLGNFETAKPKGALAKRWSQ